MKLIMRSEFDDLRMNPNHSIQVDKNGDKQVVKIYFQEQLVAKKVTLKKSIRYFGAAGYQTYLSEKHN